MIKPIVKTFFDEPTNTYSYVVSDPASKKAAIIDSVLNFDYASGRMGFEEADQIIDYVNTKGLTVEWLLETHAHADHLSALPYLQEKLGGQSAIGRHIIDVQKIFGKIFNAETDFALDGSQFDHLFEDEDRFMLGEIEVRVMHTPGHTPACLTYVFGDAVFVGDTLFMPDYGTARCDFPGGDANTLFLSVQKIFSLPDEYRVFLCHDYLPKGRDQYLHETTVGEQKQSNIHVHEGVRQDDFVQMRTERDKHLAVPSLIIPSVQVNIRAGHMPPAEDNGQVYLKVPVNKL
ncbi:MAG: MBL fold metallo-hydrolase [Pseudomonadota bacterium]|nr:MBL fold metallo-hydrolase [Pseudomonadota bacterium]